jgi:hypothetical protein
VGREDRARAAAIAALALCVAPAHAQAVSYTGQISMLEAWPLGNVAFTLNTPGVPCNGQFILNKSDAGTNRMFAILVAAKAAGTPVRVYFVTCGPAELAGGNYAQVAYLYME